MPVENPNEQKQLTQAVFPEQLDFIRVTSTQVMQQCPKSWAYNYLLPGKDVLIMTDEFRKAIKDKSIDEVNAMLEKLPQADTSKKLADKVDSGKAANIGTAMHTIIEDYAKNPMTDVPNHKDMKVIDKPEERENVGRRKTGWPEKAQLH